MKDSFRNSCNMFDNFRCIESNIFVTAYIRGPVLEVIDFKNVYFFLLNSISM